MTQRVSFRTPMHSDPVSVMTDHMSYNDVYDGCDDVPGTLLFDNYTTQELVSAAIKALGDSQRLCVPVLCKFSFEDMDDLLPKFEFKCEDFKKVKLVVPSISLNDAFRPLMEAPVVPMFNETSKRYRQEIAIPRYVAKRSRRGWKKGLMHPSRSLAAYKRQRSAGKFEKMADGFICVKREY